MKNLSYQDQDMIVRQVSEGLKSVMYTERMDEEELRGLCLCMGSVLSELHMCMESLIEGGYDLSIK